MVEWQHNKALYQEIAKILEKSLCRTDFKLQVIVSATDAPEFKLTWL